MNRKPNSKEGWSNGINMMMVHNEYSYILDFAGHQQIFKGNAEVYFSDEQLSFVGMAQWFPMLGTKKMFHND